MHSVYIRIKIEEEYAKNLSKLSQIPLAAQEEGYVEPDSGRNLCVWVCIVIEWCMCV